MKKQNDLFAELVVGLFMVAVVALLGYFTIVISGAELLDGRARARVAVNFSDVGGLKERDNVIYRGMKVGSVEKITLAGGQTTVQLSVDREVVLREGYFITVKPLSLLGGNCLLLDEGAGAELPLATTRFRGTPPVDWLRDLGEIARKVNEISGSGELEAIVSNFQAMSTKLALLTDRIERGEGTLGKLLSTNDQIYLDIASTVASAKTVAERLKEGEGLLGKALAPGDGAWEDLRRTFAHAAEVSGRLVAGEGTLGRLVSKDDALYQELHKAVADLRAITSRTAAGEGLLGRLTRDEALADDAVRLVANLKEISAKLKSGDGTLGQLVNNPELYNEINGLLRDVRQVVDNYRDTTPISTFAGLVGGAL